MAYHFFQQCSAEVQDFICPLARTLRTGEPDALAMRFLEECGMPVDSVDQVPTSAPAMGGAVAVESASASGQQSSQTTAVQGNRGQVKRSKRTHVSKDAAQKLRRLSQTVAEQILARVDNCQQASEVISAVQARLDKALCKQKQEKVLCQRCDTVGKALQTYRTQLGNQQGNVGQLDAALVSTGIKRAEWRSMNVTISRTKWCAATAHNDGQEYKDPRGRPSKVASQRWIDAVTETGHVQQPGELNLATASAAESASSDILAFGNVAWLWVYEGFEVAAVVFHFQGAL